MVDIAPYTGPVIVTLAYVLVYYAFQLHIMRVKTRLKEEYKARGEKFDRYFGNDREMLAADRYQLNMLEHMPVFLVLLWLHAVFVDAMSATIAGGIYTAARMAYPFMMGGRLGRGVGLGIVVATGPGYLVLGWLAGGLVWKLLM